MGAATFGVVSMMAAFAKTPMMLIVARALLGVAGATLAPSTLSLIRSMFHDAAQRAFAIGIWGTSFSVGRIDVSSAALSLTAVLATIYGMKTIAADGASA